MQKIEELKNYASVLFESNKNRKDLKPIKSLLLESLFELIDKYGEYMNKSNIDAVFNAKFKIRLNEEYTENSVLDNLAVFNKDKEVIYGNSPTIQLYYPLNEYNYEYYNKDAYQEYNLDTNIAKKQFASLYKKFKNTNKISNHQRKNEKTIKETFKFIIKHEISHVMAKKEIYLIDKNNYNKLSNVFKKNNNSFTSQTFNEKPYVGGCVYSFGGIPAFSSLITSNGLMDEDAVNVFTGKLLHEGMTEYISYTSTNDKIRYIAKGFDCYGGRYITASYPSYTWLCGAYNALNNDYLLKQYYKGTGNDFLNDKIVYNFLHKTNDFILSVSVLEELQEIIIDIFDKFYDEEITKQECDEKLKEQMQQFDNAFHTFQNEYKKLVDSLLNDYKKSKQNQTLSKSQEKEFLYSMKNFLSYSQTWSQLFNVDIDKKILIKNKNSLFKMLINDRLKLFEIQNFNKNYNECNLEI